MKNLFAVIALIIALPSLALAKDTWVNGYYRSDGTYVRPHVRSAPDSSRWNNYGSSDQGSNSYYAPSYSPYGRDSDGDGIWNQYDIDDDNDGKMDDYDND